MRVGGALIVSGTTLKHDISQHFIAYHTLTALVKSLLTKAQFSSDNSTLYCLAFPTFVA